MKNNKERSGKRAKILIIVFIAFMTLAFIISAVTPIFDTLCKMRQYQWQQLLLIIKQQKSWQNILMMNFFYRKDESGNIK